MESNHPKTKIRLKVWGSSHACDHHFLPSRLKETFFGSEKYEEPVFHASSGLKITKELVKIIQNDMSENQNYSQIHIILLGGNNIREGWKPASVAQLLEQIILASKNAPNSLVILCGLIPSPKTEYKTKDSFILTDKLIIKLAKKFEQNSSFFNSAKVLTHQGKVKMDCFADGIHLNRFGAKHFTTCLTNHILKIPNVKVGYSKQH